MDTWRTRTFVDVIFTILAGVSLKFYKPMQNVRFLNFENRNNSLKVINYQEVKMFDTYLVKMQLDIN